jgi:FhaA, N-terminal domain/FHA domain
MGLQRFEHGLERMVEGVFSRSSRSSIRPVELGRRLLREMDDHRSVDVKGRRIVPNSFTFHLSARDHAGFADIEHALVAELAEAAREYADDEGYHLIGPISVALLVDNNLKPGRFGIASVLREGTVQSNMPVFPPIDAPVVVPPPEMQIEIPEAAPLSELVTGLDEPVEDHTFHPLRGELVLPSGKRVAVGEETVVIGRLPECALSVNDPNVSRRHAEVRPSGTEVVVVDLGSTNGTKVNGRRITGEQSLVDGDIISVGATHLRFEAS